MTGQKQFNHNLNIAKIRHGLSKGFRPITDLRRDKKLMGNPRIQCTIDYYLHYNINYDNYDNYLTFLDHDNGVQKK